MARMRFVRNPAGVRAYLQSAAMRSAITAKASPIAAAARASGMDVSMDGATTDRAVVRIVVKDPKARAEQAKTGFLSRAAKAQGLDFKAGR